MKKKPKGPVPLFGVTKKRASFFLTPFVLRRIRKLPGASMNLKLENYLRQQPEFREV